MMHNVLSEKRESEFFFQYNICTYIYIFQSKTLHHRSIIDKTKDQSRSATHDSLMLIDVTAALSCHQRLLPTKTTWKKGKDITLSNITDYMVCSLSRNSCYIFLIQSNLAIFMLSTTTSQPDHTKAWTNSIRRWRSCGSRDWEGMSPDLKPVHFAYCDTYGMNWW